MGDQQHRYIEVALQRLHQFEDLRLDRDIERGGRLIGDQELRLADQRHGDHHALAQAARQFMRILREALLRPTDAHLLQHVEHPGSGLR